jgi:hypothetical protein
MTADKDKSKRPVNIGTDEPISDQEFEDFQQIVRQGKIEILPEAREDLKKIGLSEDEIISMSS